jgi:hypothetical protein
MSVVRRAFRTWLGAAAFIFGIFLSTTPALGAICCTCTPSGGTKTCVKSVYATCADMKSKATNVSLKEAVCDTSLLKETECLSQSAGGLCITGPVDESEFGKPADQIADQPVIVPTLNVSIPGLTFSSRLGQEKGFLTVPFLAQYISAAYKYLITVSAVAAAIMIVYGGFLYIVGSAAPQIKRGKEIITDAVIGLVLLLGAYAILSTLNPDLLSLQPLRIQRITTEDYKFMAKEAGFKNADGAEENERRAEQALTGGNAPAIGAQTGENVSIASIQATGKPVEQMRAYCTSASAAAQMQTYEQKIQALVRTILGWKKVCVDNAGCAYYRGGFTNLTNGGIQGTSLDIPFAKNAIKAFVGKDLTWSADCAQRFAAQEADFYKPAVGDGTKEGLKKAIDAKNEVLKDFRPGGKCYSQVFDQYQLEFARKFEARGIYGGDCGTTLIQAYACAGGTTARGSVMTYTSGAIYNSGSRPSGRDIVVWKAMSWNDYLAQIKAAGGLRFGDIYTIGQQNWLHNFMYTGGRQDVPFDWFEMGSSGRDGSGGTAVNVGLRAPIGGAYAWPRGTPPDYFLELAKKRGKSVFPINVFRPYDFTPCTSKAECKNGQSCRCTASDTKNFESNTCSLANVCHAVKGFTFCVNDEHCPVGQSCKKGEKAASGFCKPNT